MLLYYHPASTTCRMIMMFAAEQGIDLDYKLVDLFTGEHFKPDFAAINPNCLVPVLEDGNFRLTESAAILRYLADKTHSAAYPNDLKQRARVNEMMDWFNANFYRDFGYGLVYSQTFPQHKRPSEEIQAGTVAWGKQKAQGWLKILDEHLLGPNKPFVCGENITLADYLGVEMVAVGDLIGCRYSEYPNVERWLKRMKSLKSWPKVHEAIDGFAASIKGTPFVTI
ncbi:MAG: glutathione S-transferase [Betaproteobacteria bacterium RIFCSPLOWO2_02_FULL_62_17]|nr:MAG: glutathione S-transferase [Betaproteobacteria bacterium RIFCSPLOWO2_02_FULL_62_17]